MRGVTGPRPFRPMRVVRRRGVVRSDAVRNARAVPSQTATQNFEQLIILDPGSCYPRVLSTDNGSTPYDYLFMIFMSSDGAGLIAHAYHAYMLLQHRKSSALKPGRWIVVFGWTRKPHRATVAGKLRQALGMRTLERSYPTSTPSPRRHRRLESHKNDLTHPDGRKEKGQRA